MDNSEKNKESAVQVGRNIENGKAVDSTENLESSGLRQANNMIDKNNVYSSTLERIEELSSFYTDEKASVLEIIQQYDQLVEKISILFAKIDNLRTDAIQANNLYEVFKRDFANIIEEPNWGEKLYYALPLYEDFDKEDEWITQWCSVMQSAVEENNRENIRVFINKNLYSNVFSLPRDIYYYKAHSQAVKDVKTEVKDLIYVFSSKTWIFFKFIKDFADSLRNSLLQIITVNTENIHGTKTNFPSNEQLKTDKEYIYKIIQEEGEFDSDIVERYTKLRTSDSILKILNSPEEFTVEARELYKNVQELEYKLNKISRLIYTDSLADIYRLYDTLIRSLNDFSQLDEALCETNEQSKLCCLKFSGMIEKLLNSITTFLQRAYNIKPINIELKSDFNQYDINWYDVIIAEDAPSPDLVECVSSISDTGFAKCNSNGEIIFVTKPAKISVYSKKLALQE